MANGTVDALSDVASLVGNVVNSAFTRTAQVTNAMVTSFDKLSEGLNLVKGVSDAAFGGLQRLTGAIQSTVAAYTELFNPAATRLLEMAIRDLNASIGEALMPTLRIATAGIRAIADVIASMSPQARQLVAALAAASIAAVATAAAVGVMSAVMNTATAGIPAILGAVLGGVGALVAVGKPLEQLQNVFQKLGNIVEKVFDVMGESFSKIAESAAPLFDLIVKLTASGAERLPDMIGPLIDSFGQLITSLIPAFEAILPALLSVGAAIQNFNVLVIQVVVTALAPLLEIVGLLLKPIGLVVQGLAAIANVLTNTMRGALNAITKAFDYLFGPIVAVVRLVDDILGPSLSKLGTAVSGLWSSVSQVFGLIFDLIGKIAKLLAAPLAILAQFIGDVLIVSLQALAFVIETIANWVTILEDGVRRLFGIEKKEEGGNRVTPGSSIGKATVQASITSIDAYLDKARTSAYGLSRGSAADNDPAKQTASNTGKLLTEFETFNRNFASFMDAIGNIGSNVPSAKGVASALAPVVAPAVGLMPAMALRQFMRWQG